MQLLAAGAKDGLYWLDPNGKTGPVPALQTPCDMVHDGGGWALVAIAANDNQNSWTWNARLLWSSNQAVFGSAATPLKDFKSAGLHVLAHCAL